MIFGKNGYERSKSMRELLILTLIAAYSAAVALDAVAVFLYLSTPR